jgi:hypothetical protein
MVVPSGRGPRPAEMYPCPRPRATGLARLESPKHGGASAPPAIYPRLERPVRAQGYPSVPAGTSSRLHRTNIKGGVPTEESNHFQPLLHSLDLSNEFLAWNNLGRYGSGWMLRGCKSPLQRRTSSLFFAFDEHICTDILSFKDGITSKAETGVGAISNLS